MDTKDTKDTLDLLKDTDIKLDPMINIKEIGRINLKLILMGSLSIKFSINLCTNLNSIRLINLILDFIKAMPIVKEEEEISKEDTILKLEINVKNLC